MNNLSREDLEDRVRQLAANISLMVRTDSGNYTTLSVKAYQLAKLTAELLGEPKPREDVSKPHRKRRIAAKMDPPAGESL